MPNNNDFQIFNTHYPSIMSGLAEAAAVPQDDIIVNSLIYSSVILNTSVTLSSAPGSDASNNAQSAVDNYF